jgi:hypothetical protein
MKEAENRESKLVRHRGGLEGKLDAAAWTILAIGIVGAIVTVLMTEGRGLLLR